MKDINPELIKRLPKHTGEGTDGTCYLGTYRKIRVCVKEYKTSLTKSGKEVSFAKLCAQENRKSSVIFDLGDHPGLPMVFGICTKQMPVMLITQFHGEGDESMTIF